MCSRAILCYRPYRPAVTFDIHRCFGLVQSLEESLGFDFRYEHSRARSSVLLASRSAQACVDRGLVGGEDTPGAIIVGA
jgi:hypothetical protein